MDVRLERMSDQQLLDLRLCDLPLRIQGTRLELRVRRLYDELEERALTLHPHVWLAEEWFTPDGVSVEVKKFVVSEARHVAVQLTRRTVVDR